jgi:hypothetical protein
VDYANVEAKTDVAVPTGPVRGVRWGEGPATSGGGGGGGGGGGIVRQGRLAAPFGGVPKEAAAAYSKAAAEAKVWGGPDAARCMSVRKFARVS